MRYLRNDQIPVFAVNVIALAIFSILFFSRKNYEFIMYIAVIIIFLILLLLSNRKVNYSNGVLWGLTAWAILHMAGGGLYIGEKKFYELILIPVVGDPYHILKYDQAVHFIGFWVATIVMWQVLRPHLKTGKPEKFAIALVVVMAGLGLGALNEIVEFAATVIVPDTGVGGYTNTALDLVFDFLGCIGAAVYLKTKKFSSA